MESIEGKLYWAEKHPSQGIIIADVDIKSQFGMFEVKIKKLLFSSGKFKKDTWNIWTKGTTTTVTGTDLKDQKNTIKFVFEMI